MTSALLRIVMWLTSFSLTIFSLTIVTWHTGLLHAETSPRVVKIGAILPLTGDAQGFGAEARMAIEHAIVDADPKRFSYQLILEDDRLSATQAATSAQKLLLQDRVSVIFSN